MALGKIFEPISIGGARLANRIVRAAHGTGMASPHITDLFIEYHRARAAAGCALSIIEASRVHPSTALDFQLYGDQLVPGYQRLMAAIRPYDMRVFQQLWHGGNTYFALDGSPPWTVSDVPGPLGIVGRTMGNAELKELVNAFASSAALAEEGGLDGVEVHGAHGYLIHQFISPFYNTRDDEYGGPLENRARFLLEVLRAIRERVGPSFAVGVRLGASRSSGVTESMLKRVIQMVEGEQLIDYVNVTLGDYFRQDEIVGGMHNPAGYQLHSSADVASVSTVPRLLTGRFRTLEEAEQIIKDGQADVVSMVRAMIADPDLIRKTREGRVEEVRPCIACNQGCIGGLLRSGKVGCAVNATVGRDIEQSDREIELVAFPRRVVVVGGGPAGLEAARITALRGHHVTLFEALPHLGGTVTLARRAPALHTLGDITHWLEQEVFRHGVDVRLSTYVDAADIRAECPDEVVIATGSIPRADGVQVPFPGERPEGIDLPHVLTTHDLFSTVDLEGVSTAVVVDMVGHYEALAAIEFLMTRRIKVTFVNYMHNMVRPHIRSTWRDDPAVERFYRKGEIEFLPQHRLVEVRPGIAVVQPTEADASHRRCIGADRVVLITQNKPLDGLYYELRDELPVHLVGDANSPRDVQFAITEGYLAGRRIRGDKPVSAQFQTAPIGR